jgi:hypothetical protein
MVYPKTSHVVKHQFVHIDYMRAKKDMHFNRILEFVISIESLICYSLGTIGIKKSSLSSTLLSYLIRKR